MGETARAPESTLPNGTQQQNGASGDQSRGTPASPSAASLTPALDLYAPITSDVILEVRQGKMKAMEGLKVMSGIDKGLCTGRVKVDSTGIIGE